MRDATNTTATLTGAWTAIGMSSLEVWEKSHHLTTAGHNAVALVFIAAFFLVPVVLFVMGAQYLRAARPWPQSFANKQYWIELRLAAVRMLCWFVGAGVTGLLFMAILNALV